MESLDWLASFHGFLLVDKAAGMTSQDVITRMQRDLIARSQSGEKPLRKRDLPKMGHGGTLDPFATGLLVVAVGDGTKLARYLIDSEKEYEAEVVFGARTASGDFTNETVETTDRRPESRQALESAVRAFIGEYCQLPPMYSAKKIEGKPLYELARKGIEVERKPVDCRVLRLEILNTRPAETSAPIESATVLARVSSGTYIRTLAEDLAKKLGSLAYLKSLRRLATGNPEAELRVDRAVTLEALAETKDWSTLPAFIPFDRCLVGKLPSLPIHPEESRAILHGLKSVIETLLPRLPVDPEIQRIALYDGSALRAVFTRVSEGLGWDFERVFH